MIEPLIKRLPDPWYDRVGDALDWVPRILVWTFMVLLTTGGGIWVIEELGWMIGLLI